MRRSPAKGLPPSRAARGPRILLDPSKTGVKNTNTASDGRDRVFSSIDVVTHEKGGVKTVCIAASELDDSVYISKEGGTSFIHVYGKK